MEMIVIREILTMEFHPHDGYIFIFCILIAAICVWYIRLPSVLGGLKISLLLRLQGLSF